MLWFLIALVFLILWLAERGSRKEKEKSNYQDGLADGYEMAKDQVRQVRAHKKNDTEVLDLFLVAGDKAEDSYKAKPHPQTAQVSSATGVAHEDTISDEGLLWTGEAHPLGQVISPEEDKRQKDIRTIKNLNTILYVASFLIVAATALFVSLTMSATVKLTGLISVTVLFYVGGLVLYDRSTKLRPAALAFVGTGMAILPFIGFALATLSSMSGESAWLVTSLLGIVAYTVAAIRLQSQLISYITMAFVLSLALSAVSVLSLAVIWYFMVVIGLSVLFNCLYVLAPKSLPQLFIRPLQDTGLAITPIALVASLMVADKMDLWMYTLLFAVATLHYFMIWTIQRSAPYELAVRALAHITILILAIDITKDMKQDGLIYTGLIWLILATTQVIYSLVRLRRDKTNSGLARETTCIGVAFSLLIFSLPIWLLTDLPNHWMSLNIALIGIVSGVLAYGLKNINWLYGTLVVTAILPFLLGRGVIDPPLSFEILAGVFAALGLVALFGAERAVTGNKSESLKRLLVAAVLAYAALLALSGVLAGTNLALGWTMAFVAGMVIALSYLIRQPELEVIGSVAGIVSIAAWADRLLTDSSWQVVVTILMASAAFAVGAIIHHRFNQSQRRDYLVAMGLSVFAGQILVLTSGTTEVVSVSLVLLLVASIGAMVARALIGSKSSNLSIMALFAYVTYPVLAIILGLLLAHGWFVLTMLVSTGLVWASSYLEKRPGIILLGNGLLAMSVISLWYWLDFSGTWAVYGIAWISAAVYYLMHWYSYGQSDNQRAGLGFVSTLVALVAAAVYGLAAASDQAILASAGSLLMISAVSALYGYLQKNHQILEAAVYIATLGLQWTAGVLIPEVNLVVYAHWWAITIGLVALWRGNYKIRAVIGIGFVTVSSGLYALFGEPGYSLLFLIEHLIVAVVGALIRQQWLLWWGVVAVVLSVLYFLRGYAYLVLLFLGFLLILFVIWRLVKFDKKH